MPKFSVDLNPDNNLPKLVVTYQLTGATPELIEQEATSPLESVLSQIGGIQNIYSISSLYSGTIEITFDRDVDLDFKKFEVSSSIRQLYPKLHKALTYPQIEQRGKTDVSKQPILLYKINAPYASFEIKETVGKIFVNSLSLIQGIREVSVYGAEGLQISVDYDVDKLSIHNIAPSQIHAILQDEFSSFFPGALFLASGQKLAIKVDNNLKSIEEIEHIKLPTTSGLIQLNDLATISIQESKQRNYQRVNGLNSISLSVFADEGVNRLDLANTIKESVDQLKAKLPLDYAIELDYDDTEFLTKEIEKNYTRALLSVLILLVFILIAYRNWRHLLILFTGILVTLSITSLIGYFLKISIHLYTIAGITISFGLIIDNAIVVLDQLERRAGKSIYSAVLGATMTTIMALLLVLFLPEQERQNLTEFCIIVAISLFCSILVSLFYIPALYKLTRSGASYNNKLFSSASRMRIKFFNNYSTLITILSSYRRVVIGLLVLCFGIPIFLLPAKWDDHEWYNSTVGSELYQDQIRPVTDKILGGALRLFIRDVYERSGYRDPQRTALYIEASLPQGNTLNDMDRVIRFMETYLQSVQGIKKFITNVNSGQRGSIVIFFEKKVENGSLPYQLKSRLIAQSLDWGGVDWNIYGVGRAFSNSSGESLPNFKVSMKGYNYEELEAQSQILSDKLLKHKRIQKVNTNERLSWNDRSIEHFVLSIDKDKLSGLALTPARIALNLQEKTALEYASGSLNLNGKSIPLYVAPANGETYSTFDVLNDYQRSDQVQYQLTNTAELIKEKTANAIHKENKQYIRQVGFDYYGSYQFGDKYLTEVLTELSTIMPPGYLAEKLNWSFSWEKTKRQYSLLLLLIIGIYCISAILFESLKQPFYVIISIPISFIGLFLSFSLFDLYFDQGGYAAFVLLGGLVVNSSIFILNDFNQKRKKNRREFIKSTFIKLRPITLTILSTCMGLVPFLIGGQHEIFWFSLAAGTIGGLIVSVISIALVQPILMVDKS
ncbi:AcrB/AcrD/AcrF family protein [Chryseotalea sanaruensis]|uniref:AcrB/AcrD/AcrF family protein n=1 Tax=Chryseotalea sanaruensis TaxID=2482724 RepID=A0A401U7L1_9BACT|nr:AcrB/AcrD/AcrF family protein [Chryseotalea sanaruensis]